jgi:hypothetical protein
MKAFIAGLCLLPLSAVAYDHTPDFKLHPGADLICSNEGGLIVVDDDNETLGVGDRGMPDLLNIAVSTFKKTGDYSYEIFGKLVFKMFTSDPEQTIFYEVHVSPESTVGGAKVTMVTPEGESMTSEKMFCERR